MTEPTDAELEALLVDKAPILALVGGNVRTAVVKAMREAFAKWGTPPAVAGEPECTCSAKDMPFGTCCKVRSAFERWYDEQNDGRLQPFDVFKGGWIERHRLSSTPQSTQAQAGAVPLTEPQITSMWRDQWDGFVSFAEAEVIVRATEEAHGIKGGQHAE